MRLYSATGDHDLELHQVHDADGGRIRFRRTCEVCGEVIAFEHIDKAFDDGGRTVVLAKKDINILPASKGREIEVVEFVPSSDIDPIRLDRIAIAPFSLGQRTLLGARRVHDDGLVLQTLLWDDEVR